MNKIIQKLVASIKLNLFSVKYTTNWDNEEYANIFYNMCKSQKDITRVIICKNSVIYWK